MRGLTWGSMKALQSFIAFLIVIARKDEKWVGINPRCTTRFRNSTPFNIYINVICNVFTLLFNIYINYLLLTLRNTDIQNFADDIIPSALNPGLNVIPSYGYYMVALQMIQSKDYVNGICT